MRHSLESMNFRMNFKIYDFLRPQNKMIFMNKANSEIR